MAELSELSWTGGSAGWALLIGVMLGAAGGALHLAVTWQRARAICAGRSLFALLLLPVAFTGPALAVLLAALCSKLAAWATVPGLIAVRGWIVGRTGARHAR